MYTRIFGRATRALDSLPRLRISTVLRRNFIKVKRQYICSHLLACYISLQLRRLHLQRQTQKTEFNVMQTRARVVKLLG